MNLPGATGPEDFSKFSENELHDIRMGSQPGSNYWHWATAELDHRDRMRSSALVQYQEPQERRSVAPQPAREMKIFISHSSKDADLAEALADLLRSALNLPHKEIRCTSVPAYDMPYGADTDKRVKSDLAAAPVFIGIITPSSVESNWVLFELGARWGQDRYLIPFVAGGADFDLLPGPLKNRNAPRNVNQEMVSKMVEEVAKELGQPNPSFPTYKKYLEQVLATDDAIKIRPTTEPNEAAVSLPVAVKNPEGARRERLVEQAKAKLTLEERKFIVWLIDNSPANNADLQRAGYRLLPQALSEKTEPAVKLITSVAYRPGNGTVEMDRTYEINQHLAPTIRKVFATEF